MLLEQCPPKELIRQELSRSACRLAGVAEALRLPGRRQVHHADSQQFIPDQDRGGVIHSTLVMMNPRTQSFQRKKVKKKKNVRVTKDVVMLKLM